MAQYGFGIGMLSVIPNVTNPTPVQIGVIKDVAIDVSMQTKQLRGAYQFPVDVARAAGSVTGKAKFAALGAGTMGAILNVTPTTGYKVGIANESGTPTTNVYTVTNGATFYEDMGVIKVATGLPMTRVASAPATGQYSVNTTTGAYTFAAGDSNPPCYFSYSYTVAASGFTASYTNQPMGSSVVFTLALFQTFRSKNFGLRLPAVTIPKLAFALKQDDYTDEDLDFEAFADTTGKVMDWFSTE